MAQIKHGPGSLNASRPRPTQPIMTAEQDRFVAELFEKYIPAEFSAEDASEIIGALEDQGLRGPGVRSAVITAGLDAEKFIRQVALTRER